jgi:CheY-like chemotaxis protein
MIVNTPSLCVLQLEGFGYDVRAATSDESAIALAYSFAPTAIVTDPSDDNFDPFVLLRELRIQQPHTPIILTATARTSSVETALRAVQEEGAYHYFEKPSIQRNFSRSSSGPPNWPRRGWRTKFSAVSSAIAVRSVNWSVTLKRCSACIC